MLQRHIAQAQIQNLTDDATTRDYLQAALLAHFDGLPSFGEECGRCTAGAPV